MFMRNASLSIHTAATVCILSLLVPPLVMANTEPPWTELSNELYDEKSFQVTKVDDWFEQCVAPFDFNGLNAKLPVSNYMLIDQPSGLCMDAVLCAYTNCTFAESYLELIGELILWGELGYLLYNPPSYKVPEVVPEFPELSYLFSDEYWKTKPRLNLPDAVVHVETVKDISEVIKYAATHSIGISVKTSGHSYTGASTRKDTVLINMSRFTKYTKYSSRGSIRECGEIAADKDDAYFSACALARARKKDAVVRIGGGELIDEALRAVSNTNKYHIVLGASGSVGASGGWLQSGGLGINSGSRLYGVGVDQALHLEMVLPDGHHVRFGPSEWKEEDGKMYPQTTKVTGYYNVGDLSDEKSWSWEKYIGDDMDFSELWFAVRGGGGGSFGVVTAVYYQLHAIPGSYAIATFNVREFHDELNKEGKTDQALLLLKRWIEFLLKFMYDPQSINVSEETSNSCGSNWSGGFRGGYFHCFNGAAEIMQQAWFTFVGSSIPDIHLTENVFKIEQYHSHAHYLFNTNKDNPNIPAARASEGPSALVVAEYKWAVWMGDWFALPTKALVNKRDEIVEILFDVMTSKNNTSYTGHIYQLGGKMAVSGDGMDAYTRRHLGLNMLLPDPDKVKLNEIFYEVGPGEVYKGSDAPKYIDHNHAETDGRTPLKSDWTKLCDITWTVEKRTELCYSFAESVWGINVLKKLQKIHDKIDPYHLFETNEGVGYTQDAKVKEKRKKEKRRKVKKGKKSSKSL